MTIIFTRGIAVTFEAHLPLVSDAAPTPTVTLYDGDGTELLSAASLTRDTTSTTLAEFAAKGENRVRVASASGITPGYEYLIGSSTGEIRELRRALQVRGTDVLLGGPLHHDHALGTALTSTRVYASITAGTFPAAVRYGKARIAYEVSDVAQILDLQFAVSEHALTTVGRLLAVADPSLLQRLSEGVDLDATMSLARDVLEMDIGRRWPAWLQRGTFVGYDIAHMWKTLELLAIHDRPEQAARYKAEYADALAAVVTQPTVDHDDDNAVSPAETATWGARTYERN